MVYRLKKNIWLKRSKFRGLNVKSVFLIQIWGYEVIELLGYGVMGLWNCRITGFLGFEIIRFKILS